MKFQFFKFILLFLLAHLNVYPAPGQSPAPLTTQFHAPLDLPLILSGNFGEIRSDHFHSGIDIKTQGVSGKKLYAIDDGHVSRIKIESAGYGRTLYIHHPGGYTSVYAHCSAFIPEFQSYIRNEQYRRKKHTVNIYPEKGLLPVKRGQLIAYSGNSGYSFGPHLHFEIRNSANQHPLNVLHFNFNIPDTKEPRILRLGVYPLGNESFVNDESSKVIYKVRKSGDRFILDENEILKVHGEIAFGVEAYDYMDRSPNRHGIYSMEVTVDGQRIYAHSMDEFSFAESRYINTHIDYALRQMNRQNIQMAYLTPNNKLSIYDYVQGTGSYHFRDNLEHTVHIVVSDVAGNTAVLEFKVKSQMEPPLSSPANEKKSTAIFYWNQDNQFSSTGIKINMHAKTLYDNLEFDYRRSSNTAEYLSDIHHLHNPYVPVHGYYELAIVPDRPCPQGKEDNLYLVRLGEDEDEAVGGTYSDGYVRARIRLLGDYAVAIDTTAPEIRPVNISNNANLSGSTDIKIRIKDSKSGIASYDGFIDNSWALFEYDLKNDLLVYEFDENRVEKGKNHILELYITDERGNTAMEMYEFFW